MLIQWIILSTAVTIHAEMEGFIVGGSFAAINRYPHSAFLTVNCRTEDGQRTTWICGSSILNQRLLLTAAHCLYSCTPGTQITVNMGSEDREGGISRTANAFTIHERYIHELSAYDIALVKMTKPVRFNSKIRRVAIMSRPPYNEPAKLAGWGQTNERTKAQGTKLKQVDQKVWKHADCEEMFGGLPRGTICASSQNPDEFAAPGDSGSALVTRNYIQIGLVSFKKPLTAANIIVYTDVGYFYEWIVHNSYRLYCYPN